MPRRPDVPCAACGTLLWSGGAGSLPAGRRTCRQCRRAGLGPCATETRPCERCGTPVTRRPSDFGRRAFCSLVCANKREGIPWKSRSCEVCGAFFDASHSGQRTCSRACGTRINARQVAGRSKPERASAPRRTCRNCGKASEPGEKWQKLCSNQCRIDASGHAIKNLYALACATGGAGAQWRKLLLGYLRQRDGDRCQICRRPIRFDLKSGPQGDDRGPSIDHMIPRSKGGGDDPVNLRLTHWGCNRKRKAGTSGEALQLALIG